MTPFHEMGGSVRHRLLLHGPMEKPARLTSGFHKMNPWRSTVSVGLELGFMVQGQC